MLAIFWGIIIIILILFIHKEGLARNKKDIKKYIYMFLIFITTSIIVYALISKIEFFQKVFSTSKYLIYDKIVVFVLSMSIAILLIGLLAPFIQKLYETSVITRYERKHKHEKHQYYRDIVKSESPAILSYCYNKKINIEDAVVAILLNLNMKNIISIDEDNIIILKNTNKLYSHEPPLRQ